MGSILAAGILCLCCMIPYAYWDRPRIEIETVDADWLKLCLSARVTVTGETYIYQTWACTTRKGERSPNCGDLSARLSSAAFLQQYEKAAANRYGDLAELFAGPDVARLAFRCERVKYLSPAAGSALRPAPEEFNGVVVWGILSKPAPEEFNGVVVGGILSKRFLVHRPKYQWSDWLQSHLPFMPDRARLQEEADELNKDAIVALDRQVRRECPDLEWERYWP